MRTPIHRLNDGHIITWESEGSIATRNSNICTLSNESVPMPDNTDMLTKYRGNRRVSPRPAVVRTTWCDFSSPHEQPQLGTDFYDNSNICNEDVQHKWFQNEVCHQQQTLIAEHSVELPKLPKLCGEN